MNVEIQQLLMSSDCIDSKKEHFAFLNDYFYMPLHCGKNTWQSKFINTFFSLSFLNVCGDVQVKTCILKHFKTS